VRAVLLAAGVGTRLRPITYNIPKCLVPIQGRPLLAYWLDLLLQNGIERVLINTHYFPDVVREFVERSRWRNAVDLVHEDMLLGTGGTVLHNRSFVDNAAFMVAHADNLTRFDVKTFIEAHAKRRAGVEITMMTFDTDAPHSCGIVEQDRQGIVVALHEKTKSPPGKRANAAIYIFEPSVIDFLASLKKNQIDLSLEVLPHFLGRMQGFHNSDYHRDIGTPESYRLAEQEF
jgi:mannose-1-phosphate guanylyltransferase